MAFSTKRNELTFLISVRVPNSSLPAGRYQLRLVVVDHTGNFLPPFELWVTV